MLVHGKGRCPCDFLICGEGPGYWEDQRGEPFVGKTGDELDRCLEDAGLPTRRHAFLTNIYRLYQGKDYVYTAADLARDEPFLLAELHRVTPTIIVTLGRHAARYFLGDVDMDDVWGIPWMLPAGDKLSFLGNSVVFPIHHPAAGMYNPDMSPYVVAGFGQLALFLDGKLETRVLFDDPYPEVHYEEITTTARLLHVARHWTEETLLSIDTEGWPALPWSLQFSTQPGTAYLIRKNRTDLLNAFHRHTTRRRPRLVFHSALHDLSVGRALETPFDGLPFHDTMILAYLLQLEPRGLKGGALRHCNMQMQSYAEVIGDVANNLARSYLTWLWDREQVEYEEARQEEFNWQRAAGRRIKKLPTLPKTPLHKAVARVLQSKRPASLWQDQTADIQVAGHHYLGPLPEATLDYVPPAVAIHYGCRDADATGRLLPEYLRRVDALGLRPPYDLELASYPFIDRMQRIGVKPDLVYFRGFSETLQHEIGRLNTELARTTGRVDFNANSGEQTADYLFGTLDLEELKMTPSGDRGSTDDKILEALEHEHPELPVISDIRHYRETYKLQHTFVDCLSDFVNRWPFDGRIHAAFRSTLVTGRLAASDPNLLAQPEHGTFAEGFKRGWIAEPGHSLCSWDESQVELRGLAELSRDPVLVNAFRTGQDLHAKLAHRIFGGPESQYLNKCYERFAVKEINFGIPNGMGPKGLMLALRAKGVSADLDTATRWLEETQKLYKGVEAYKQACIAEALQHGYIRCLSGRIRYIGGIRSRDEYVRAEAERLSFSTKIQESATMIMKQAEATIYDDILVPYWKDGRWVEPILQVHDCIKLECAQGLEYDLHRLMTEAMTNVPKTFCVPLAVEGEWGPNLAEMERFQ